MRQDPALGEFAELELFDGEKDDRETEGKGDRNVGQYVQYLVLPRIFIELHTRSNRQPDQGADDEAQNQRKDSRVHGVRAAWETTSDRSDRQAEVGSSRSICIAPAGSREDR